MAVCSRDLLCPLFLCFCSGCSTINFLSFQYLHLNDVSNFYRGNGFPSQINILVWVRPRGEATNRVMNLARGIIWPSRNGLLSELANGGDVRAQHGQILCTSDADSLAIQFDFESDHKRPNVPSSGTRADYALRFTK